jgi:hypothetical protein
MLIKTITLLIFTFLYHITISQHSNIRSNNPKDKFKAFNQPIKFNNLEGTNNHNQKQSNNNSPFPQIINEMSKPFGI